MRKFVGLVLTAVLLLGLSASAAAAKGVQPLKVDPSRFIFETNPGGELTGSITVINKGTDPADLKAVLSDWTLDLSNRIVMAERGTQPSSLSGAIKFNPRSFTLKPGGRQIVRFTIKVPREAKPGELRGMIAFEQAVPQPGDLTGAAIKAQVTSTIYAAILPVERKCEAVRGEVVRDQDRPQTRLVLEVKGTGTAHFRGTGRFKVFQNGDQEPVAEGDFGIMVVLPEVTTRFTGAWQGSLPPGKYRAEVLFEPEQAGVSAIRQTLSFVLD